MRYLHKAFAHITKYFQSLKQQEDMSDLGMEELQLVNKVKPYTMAGTARCVSLMRSVDYLLKNDIKGDFVECGVWKGGSAMIMAEKLIAANRTDIPIWLYDTFEGMSEPTSLDTSFDGKTAVSQLAGSDIQDPRSVWCYSNLQEVQRNLARTGYPQDNILYIRGRVEETIPKTAPERIALLRLDTDWYESTKHELEHLFPRLVRGGILLIDDYGHWEGCRKAVDEFMIANNITIFLSRIDYTGRIAVKT